MSYTISMDRAGRIVIPKPVRERIGADGAIRFGLDLVLGRIELTPLPEPNRASKIVEKDGMWVAAATGKEFSAAEALRKDRDDREDMLTRNVPTGESDG